jgi:aminomethyltransferase
MTQVLRDALVLFCLLTKLIEVFTMKKTALYDEHVKHGATMVDFAGYVLPISYTGIVFEHTMVRNKCGLFDVSHMGEIVVKGKDAFAFIQYIFTNDFSTLKIGSVRYSPMCYLSGGCVDDVLVYKIAEDEFYLVVNASNVDKDFDWLNKNNTFDVTITDISNKTSQIAIQGPFAQKFSKQCFDALPEKYYTFITTKYMDKKIMISRTGYTGEDGFEIYCDALSAPLIWRELLDIGKDDITVCGLGARDTLRLECAMPLYGQEISQDVSPIQAGLLRFVKLEKQPNFIGKQALLQQRESGKGCKSFGLVLLDNGIARQGDRVFIGENDVGYITSGTKSITVKKSIALCLLTCHHLKPDDTVIIKVRNKALKAKIVKKPFYKRNQI